MADGIVIREAHFPGRAPVDAYGNGGFRFADMSHRGSILCLPSGVHGWKPADPLKLTPDDFQRAIDEADKIEILLLGAGKEPRPFPPELRQMFRNARISVDAMSTGAAVRTYNVLLAEDRAVAAALVAVE
jgi:uncharacterized protein